MAILGIGPLETYTTYASALAAASSVDILEQRTAFITENLNVNKNIEGIQGDSPTSKRVWIQSGSSQLLQFGSIPSQAIFVKDLVLRQTAAYHAILIGSTPNANLRLTFENIDFDLDSGVGCVGIGFYGTGFADLFIADICRFFGGLVAGCYGISTAINVINGFTVKNSIFDEWYEGFHCVNSRNFSIGNFYNNTFNGNVRGISTTARLTAINNLFIGNGDDVYFNTYGFGTEADFTYCGFSTESAGAWGTGCLFGLIATDECVNPTADDFHLKAGAQSIKAGTDLSGVGVTTDFDGLSRPQDTAYCLGAYEFPAAIPPVPPTPPTPPSTECPSLDTITESYCIFNGTLRINSLFELIDRTPLEIISVHRTHTGNLHINRRYVKDVFTIRIPKITCAQYRQFQLMLRETGYNALHTVEYHYPCGVKLWDGVTPWGYGINEDVRRVRNKVYIAAPAIPHWAHIADTFSVDLECEEA